VVVVKSKIGGEGKAPEHQNPCPNCQSDQPEVSNYDRFEMAELFEPLRRDLIRYFENRDCHDPDLLADITISRVCEKPCGEEVVNLTAYAIGFARNIFFEYLKGKVILEDIEELKYKLAAEPSDENDAELRERKSACYEQCLAELEKEERELLFAYYQFQGQRKVKHRLKMAEQMGITREILTQRVYHLKQKVQKRFQERFKNM
jgi:RNA polymerase sigma factor (sigma-70 family)